jgi:hypothetical protein
MWLEALLGRVVDLCRRRAVAVVVAATGLAILAGGFAATHLGVLTDSDQLFSQSLPWRKHAREFDRLFPQFRDLLVVVIDGDAPETAEATAKQLTEALAADTSLIRTIRRPDSLPFFDTEGLLFLDRPLLEKVLDQTIDAQPSWGNSRRTRARVGCSPHSRSSQWACSTAASTSTRRCRHCEPSTPRWRMRSRGGRGHSHGSA